jgi:hypothetical protein
MAGTQPKRVILRLRVNQFEGRDSSEYDEAIKAYLTFAKRPTSELAANKHYAHIEPFQESDRPGHQRYADTRQARTTEPSGHQKDAGTREMLA